MVNSSLVFHIVVSLQAVLRPLELYVRVWETKSDLNALVRMPARDLLAFSSFFFTGTLRSPTNAGFVLEYLARGLKR